MTKLTAQDMKERQEIMQEVQTLKAQFEAQQIATLPGTIAIKELLETWKELRPKMTAYYKKLGVLRGFAMTKLADADQAYQKNLQAGMYSTDAREQANQFLMEWSEQVDEEEQIEMTLAQMQRESPFLFQDLTDEEAREIAVRELQEQQQY